MNTQLSQPNTTEMRDLSITAVDIYLKTSCQLLNSIDSGHTRVRTSISIRI